MIKRQGGMVLLTVLIVMFVIALFIAAGLSLNSPRQVSFDQAKAQQAAQAGLDYATIRLQEDPDWKGDLNRVVVNTPTLYIEEDQGNVVGLQRSTPAEPFSAFRLRFNFQNGAPTLHPLDDGLDDPSRLALAMEYVCVNNLSGGTRPVPRADSSSVVSDFNTGPYQISTGTAVVCVEGLAGKAMKGLTPSTLGSLNSLNATSYKVEAIMQPVLDDPARDAAVMAGESLDFSLAPGSNKVEITAKGETARARSKGDVSIQNGGTPNYDSQGELSYPASSTLNGVNLSPSVSVVNEAASDPFYTLDWSDIHQADQAPNTSKAVHIPGGTYVWWDDDSLHYYDLSFSDYKTQMAVNPNAPGTVLSSDLGEIRTATNLTNNPVGVDASGGKFKVSKDLKVVTSPGAVSEFTLIPRRGTQRDSSDTSALTGAPGVKYGVDFDFSVKPGGEEAQAAFTADGDILIAAKLDAQKGGSIVADGNLRLDAAKFESLGSVGISLYASGDLDVSTYHPESGDYGKVKIEGMYYAWHDLTVQAGEATLDKYADVELKGALVAYGSDVEPSTVPPGTAGGALRLYGKKIKIEWDAKKLGDLLDSARLADRTRMQTISFIRR